jgi:hypothetical protein
MFVYSSNTDPAQRNAGYHPAEQNRTSPVQLATLRAHIGSERYPERHDISRVVAGRNCHGGSELLDYQTYLDLSRQYLDGDKGVQPLFTQQSFTQTGFNHVWINLTSSEQLMDRKPPEASLGNMALVGSFHAALAQAHEVIVVSFFNTECRLQPATGRVQAW